MKVYFRYSIDTIALGIACSIHCKQSTGLRARNEVLCFRFNCVARFDCGKGSFMQVSDKQRCKHLILCDDAVKHCDFVFNESRSEVCVHEMTDGVLF